MRAGLRFGVGWLQFPRKDGRPQRSACPWFVNGTSPNLCHLLSYDGRQCEGVRA